MEQDRFSFFSCQYFAAMLTVSKNEFRRESQVEVWFAYSSEEQEDARNYSHNMQGYIFFSEDKNCTCCKCRLIPLLEKNEKRIEEKLFRIPELNTGNAF